MATLDERIPPVQVQYDDIPRTADERATLVTFLEWQRSTLARKCSGLTAEQLRRRSAAPSTLSLLGLVRHLTDVERGWFRRTLALEDVGDLYATEADPDADLNDIDGADVGERRVHGLLVGDVAHLGADIELLERLAIAAERDHLLAQRGEALHDRKADSVAAARHNDRAARTHRTIAGASLSIWARRSGYRPTSRGRSGLCSSG